MVFTLGHNDVLDAVSKQEVIKLVAADLTAEVREEGLGAAADARDELDICLLNTGLLTVRDKNLGSSLQAHCRKQTGCGSGYHGSKERARGRLCRGV